MERIALPWKSIGHMLERAAARQADRPMLMCGGQTMTFGEVNRRVNRVANAFQRTLCVRKGDRVSVMLPTGFDLPIIWLATAKLGAMAVLTNTSVQQDMLAYLLGDAGASQVILDAAYLPTLQQIGEQLRDLNEIIIAGQAIEEYTSFEVIVDESSEDFTIDDIADIDLATIQYTAGAMGDPKGCMTTHRYWMVIAHLLSEAYGVGADDVLLTTQPFYQLDPQWLLMLCLASGAPLVLLADESPAGFWKAVSDNGVTLTYLPPTLQSLLMSRPENPHIEQSHALRLVATSAINAGRHAEYERRWAAPWRELFRMTEAGVAMLSPLEDRESVGSGAMGALVPTKEARIVDAGGADVNEGSTGELLMRGDPMMLGYWNKPEETTSALRGGWLHTGDLVWRDGQGAFHWAGRL